MWVYGLSVCEFLLPFQLSLVNYCETYNKGFYYTVNVLDSGDDNKRALVVYNKLLVVLTAYGGLTV